MNAFSFCFAFRQAAFLTMQRLAIVPVHTHHICSTELPNLCFSFLFCKSRCILYANLTRNWTDFNEVSLTAHHGACEKAAVIWPWPGSAFASPCLVLAEKSPPENCWLLSLQKLSKCHILKSMKGKRTFRNRSTGCTRAREAAMERKKREDSPRYILT